jgi:hypothetical protein
MIQVLDDWKTYHHMCLENKKQKKMIKKEEEKEPSITGCSIMTYFILQGLK